jgi:cell division protease FtsH
MNLRNLAVWGVIATILLALYTVMSPSNGSGGSELSYSGLTEMIDAGQVAEARLRGESLVAQDSAGKRYTAVVPPAAQEALVQRMESNGVNIRFDRLSGNGFMTILLNLLPILLLVGVWIFFMRQMQGGARGAMGFGKSKAKLLTENKNRVTFEDVAGVDEAKDDLQEVVDFLKEPSKFQRLGGKIPKGAPAGRPSGTGKTLLARAVAARRACPSSPSRARTSWRCSWAWAPAACATCSNRPRRTRPASSSSTRSTPWAVTAARAWAAATTSASRR